MIPHLGSDFSVSVFQCFSVSAFQFFPELLSSVVALCEAKHYHCENTMNADARLLRILSLGTIFFCFWVPHVHGQAGVPLWTNYFGGVGIFSGAVGVAVDSHGKAFVAGLAAQAASSDSAYLTIAYSPWGQLLWTNSYNGPVSNGEDTAAAITVDSQGSVYVTGRSVGTNGSGDLDYATIKYSNSGLALWTNRYHFLAGDRPRAIRYGCQGECLCHWTFRWSIQPNWASHHHVFLLWRTSVGGTL